MIRYHERELYGRHGLGGGTVEVQITTERVAPDKKRKHKEWKEPYTGNACVAALLAQHSDFV